MSQKTPEVLMQEAVDSIPTTLDEAVAALDAMLGPEDKAYLQAAYAEQGDLLHHSLGRKLRNEWGFWMQPCSLLASHLREVHKVKHPDDMSGFIIREYCHRQNPTVWEKL